MFDIITIGGATQDIFVDSDFEKILTIKKPQSQEALLCFDYGAKIEIDKLKFDIGGGAVNTAVNFSNLGFKTATIIKLGSDLNAQAVLARLKEKQVDNSLVSNSDKYKTGISIILTSFEGDRTVLTHKGANSHISLDEIPWKKIKNSKWIYIASLSGDSNSVLDKLADFAEENNISMAFNPGSTQIKRGLEDLKKVLSTAEVLIMNSSEASMITEMNDIDKMLCDLKSYGPKIVVITEGKDGVKAFDGKTFYFAPPFPSKVLSTLGAGDAFASTFVSMLDRFNWNIEKSLIFASINAASVIQSFGAQTGLKTFNKLEEINEQNKNFTILKKE
ncbi:MAG: carbohydrate kinase family protein [bacterium]